MTDTYDDGGPAFPWVCESQFSGWGMSLADWLAGKAMAAMVAGPGAQHVADRDGRYDETNWAQIVASNAYDFAVATIAEKRRREGGE